MIQKLFKLKENHTDIATEITAGTTTFMTMAYIIALNPNILTDFGKNGQDLWNGIFLGTCIASAITMFWMAFFANKPYALAPGMGINSFFAILVLNAVALTGMSYLASYQTILTLILAEGLIFLLISGSKARDKIVGAIPAGIRAAVTPAIGMFLINIGFGSNASIITDSGSWSVLSDFFGALNADGARKAMGDSYPAMILTVATMFTGLFSIIVLSWKKVRGAVIIGMLIASAVHWTVQALFLHSNPFAGLSIDFLPPFGDMFNTVFFKFNFQGVLKLGLLSSISLVIVLCMVDIFSAIGSIIGLAALSPDLQKDGEPKNMRETLMCDSIGTITGSAFGMPTVTTFSESASGIGSGGRTGLTSLTTGILFLACVFIGPLAKALPPAATSAALIYVGILMLMELNKLDFSDVKAFLPSAVMLIAMPISNSIGNSIGLALISDTIIKMTTGRAKEVSAITYVLSAMFLVNFFVPM